MTISNSQLVIENKDKYRVVILPETGTDTIKCVYKTLRFPHPASHVMTDFVISTGTKEDGGVKPGLHVLEKINWKNPTIRGLDNTGDGRPYRCLFITRDVPDAKKQVDSGEIIDVPATVIGTMPEVYLLTPFSVVYLVLGHFKNKVEKMKNDGKESDSRLLSLEDLIDSICDNNDFIKILVNDYQFDLSLSLSIICQIETVPNMDSDDESEDDKFFKVSFTKISEFITNKIRGLAKYLQNPTLFKSLQSRMSYMYPRGLPENITELLWKRQAISLLSTYVDQWFIDMSIRDSPEFDFTPVDTYMNELKVKQREQELIEDSLQQLHEGTVAVMSGSKKKNESSKKAKTMPLKASKPKVAAGKGALDMFFKKKD